MVKLGQMEQTTFEALRDEIVGGDVKNVHLVKGLDRKLLERVRRGEDVLSDAGKADQTLTHTENPAEVHIAVDDVDIEEELAKIESRGVQPVTKAEADNKGQMAPPPPAGRKRTRDDILKELKASRQVDAMNSKAPDHSLGPRFTKLGEKREKSRIEKDERGREVLFTVDESGRTKRKVKKTKLEERQNHHGLLMPDRDVKPLGIDVVQQAPTPEEDVVDIFDGVGADYDPLAGLEDDDESDHTTDQVKTSSQLTADISQEVLPASADRMKIPPPPLSTEYNQGKRDYFGRTSADENADAKSKPPDLTDPTILAALKKASTISLLSTSGANPEDEQEAAKLTRRKKMLEFHDRDAEDMDLGFGSSRFGDEEEADQGKVKLSVWGKDGQAPEGKGEGKGPRKRGPKKRKGDANNVADVLEAMERRKGENR